MVERHKIPLDDEVSQVKGQKNNKEKCFKIHGNNCRIKEGHETNKCLFGQWFLFCEFLSYFQCISFLKLSKCPFFEVHIIQKGKAKRFV